MYQFDWDYNRIYKYGPAICEITIEKAIKGETEEWLSTSNNILSIFLTMKVVHFALFWKRIFLLDCRGWWLYSPFNISSIFTSFGYQKIDELLCKKFNFIELFLLNSFGFVHKYLIWNSWLSVLTELINQYFNNFYEKALMVIISI